jgi:hypothetical protein
MSIEKGSDDEAAENRGKRPVPGVGEVKGSGAGAGGGGNPEDYDDDPVGGGGAVPTGKGRDAQKLS